MENSDKPQQTGGIYNYFQGATIHNMVINGNMTKSGNENYYQEEQKSVTTEQMAEALKQCSTYIWGNSAYGVAFCVCRDIYHGGDNASLYERKLGEQGIEIPEGTVNTAMSRNPWMRYHIDSWEQNGASERALKLRDAFKLQVLKILASAKKTA